MSDWRAIRAWCLQSAITARRLPAVRGPAQVKTAWPHYPNDWVAIQGKKMGWDAYHGTAPKVRRTPPTPAEIAEMEQFIGLVNDSLDETDRRAIWMYGELRATPGRSIAAYCRDIGSNHDAYNRALRPVFKRLFENAMSKGVLVPKSAIAFSEKTGANRASSARAERTYQNFERQIVDDTRTPEQRAEDMRKLPAVLTKIREQRIRERERREKRKPEPEPTE